MAHHFETPYEYYLLGSELGKIIEENNFGGNHFWANEELFEIEAKGEAFYLIQAKFQLFAKRLIGRNEPVIPTTHEFNLMTRTFSTRKSKSRTLDYFINKS